MRHARDPNELLEVLGEELRTVFERWHQSLKVECIQPGTPLSPDDARRLVAGYVAHYNQLRLHSAIGLRDAHDMLVGRQAQIHAERDRKLEAARQQRQLRRRQAA